MCGGHCQGYKDPGAGRHNQEGEGKGKRGRKKSKEQNPEPEPEEQPQKESKVSGNLIINEDAEQEYY